MIDWLHTFAGVSVPIAERSGSRIESALPGSYLLQSAAMKTLVRQRAVDEFSRLRVWDTEYNNGVLIYLMPG